MHTHTGEPDVAAVSTQLESYLKQSTFTTEPEGRAMPKFDLSSQDNEGY